MITRARWLPWLYLLSSGVVAAATPTMQAALVTGARIQIVSVPRPRMAADQLLIEVRDASVNPADWQLATQRVLHGVRQGSIPGFDGAGVVAEVGAKVAHFKRGDPVIFWSANAGAYAQYVAVSIDAVVDKPANLSFAQAASLPHAGLAALSMLTALAPVQPGQRVLVLGGAGGVGSASVQIAKLRGAQVSATASATNAGYLRTLGADPIDYQTQHFEAGPRNIDTVVNTVDMDNGFRALAVIRAGGHLLSTTGLPAEDQCQRRQIVCAAPPTLPAALQQGLRQLAVWAAAGQLKVNIDRSFALADTLRAWQYSQAGHTRGKCVIHISD